MKNYEKPEIDVISIEIVENVTASLGEGDMEDW